MNSCFLIDDKQFFYLHFARVDNVCAGFKTLQYNPCFGVACPPKFLKKGFSLRIFFAVYLQFLTNL